jgi:hypothetical protein
MTAPLDGRGGKPSIPERTSEKMPSTSPWLSVASLALAIVALVVFGSVMAAWPVVSDNLILIVSAVAGVILGVGAVVTGVVARRRIRRGEAGRGGVALAGIVLGVVAAVVPAIFLAVFAYNVYYQYDQYHKCLTGSGYPKRYCLEDLWGVPRELLPPSN